MFSQFRKEKSYEKAYEKTNYQWSITTDPINILNEQRRFYQELYKGRNKSNEVIEHFLKDLLIPKLSEEQKMSCEGRITSEEVLCF